MDHARLDRADFAGCTFIDCRFAGIMRNVQFNSRWWQDPPDRPPRLFAGIDLSEARLRNVEFRNITFDDTVFPTDPDHIVLEPFRCIAAHAKR